MNRHQQRNRHAQPQDPPTGRKERHVHVVQHEHLIPQDGQTVEILAPLLVRDGGDRREQRRDVRLERNRHLVAEPALDPDADGLEKPGGSGRHAEREHGQPDARPVATERSLAEQLEPVGQQRVGQRRQQHERERRDDHRRLVPVAELAQAPHRGERRREIVARRRRFLRRGRHRLSLPRPRR